MPLPSWLLSPPPWTEASGPLSSVVLRSQCRLSRNVAAFPFPGRCGDAEKKAVERQVHEALTRLNLMEEGAYLLLDELSLREQRLLAEQGFLTPEALAGAGQKPVMFPSENGAAATHCWSPMNPVGRAVYIPRDRRYSILVNALDHVSIGVMASGLCLDEIWSLADTLDDQLADALDYAYDHTLGFLCASPDLTGTGLRAAAVLHAPGLAGTDMTEWNPAKNTLLHGVEAESCQGGVLRFGMGASLWGDWRSRPDASPDSTLGHCFLLSNGPARGCSEEEYVFHVRQGAHDLAERELNLRDESARRKDAGLDRLGRACGLAAGAHGLSLRDLTGLWSELRLGVERGLSRAWTLAQLDAALVQLLPAHLDDTAATDNVGEDSFYEDFELRRAEMLRQYLNLGLTLP